MSDTITIERWETDWETVGEVTIADMDYVEAGVEISRVLLAIVRNLFGADEVEFKPIIPVVWAEQQRALIFHQSISKRGYYFGLGFSPPRLLAIPQTEDAIDCEILLEGKLDDLKISAWLEDPKPTESSLEREPVNSIVGVDAVWGEYSRWFGNMSRLLETYHDILLGEVRVGLKNGSFDLIASVQVEEQGPFDSIGRSDSSGPSDDSVDRCFELGLSLGDTNSHAEPFVFVRSVYLHAQPELPRLGGGGTWHNGSWMGAVLPASKLIYGAATKDGQVAEVRQFVQSAVRAVESLLFIP